MALTEPRDYSKLPKWAQNEIARLKRNEEMLREDLRRAGGVGGKSRVFVPDYNDYPTGGRVYLSDNATIRFLKDEKHFIDVAWHYSKVLVRASEKLLIEPSASNTAYVSDI